MRCVCVWLGAAWVESLGFTSLWEQGECSACVCFGCGGVCGGLDQGLEGCYVCVSCESGLSV